MHYLSTNKTLIKKECKKCCHFVKKYFYGIKQNWLVVLRLNVPVNNFSVMSGRSHRFLVINQYFRGVKCLAQGHNTAAVGLEPWTSRSGVRHSTTEPPRSPKQNWTLALNFLLISMCLQNLMNFHHCLFKILKKNQNVTDRWKDGRTDNVKTVYPPTNIVCGGYK